MADLQVKWIKNTENAWCGLQTIDLKNSHFDDLYGVYMIWQGGPVPRCIRIGQGMIRERIAHHRTDPELDAYRDKKLFVTWAKVPADQLDGVEAYLVQQYKPLAGDRPAKAKPISVNLPG